VTVSWQSFDLLAGPSPSRQNQLRTKKEYSLVTLGARSSTRTLAGLKRLYGQVDVLLPTSRAEREALTTAPWPIRGFIVYPLK
jgi:hypothetical protein